MTGVEAVDGERVGRNTGSHGRGITIVKGLAGSRAILLGDYARQNWHRLQTEMVPSRILKGNSGHKGDDGGVVMICFEASEFGGCVLGYAR